MKITITIDIPEPQGEPVPQGAESNTERKWDPGIGFTITPEADT